MGFRFRKSKNFGPFRVNVSKSGIGWSVGTKGARYTKRADGKTQTTLSVPGTGISYVEVSGKKKDSSNNGGGSNNNNFSNNNNNYNGDNNDKVPFYKKSLFIWLMLFILPPVGIILMWGTKKYNKKPRIALSLIFALYAFIMYTPGANGNDTNTNLAQNKTQIQSNNKKEDLTKAEKEQQAAQEAEKQKIAQEKAAAEEAEKQKIAQEKAAAEEAEKQRIAQEQAAAEEAEQQRIAQEQAAAEAVRQRAEQVQESQSIGQTVYIAASGNGKKYHSNPNCSNMNGTVELSVNEALGRGYTPCSKCH